MTELALLRRYADNRDAEAFRELVLNHQAMVYNACLRCLGNVQQAEDATQDVFLSLAKNAGAVKKNLGAWLHTAAVNRSRDTIRSEQRRRRHEAAARESAAPQLTGEPDWPEIKELIDSALLELDESARDLVIRRYFLQQTQARIAQEIGLSQASVSRKINQAIAQVRERLESRGVTVAAGALTAMATAQASAQAIPVGLSATLMKIGVAGLGKTAATAGFATATGISLGIKVGMGITAAVLVVTAVLVIERAGQPQTGSALSADSTPIPTDDSAAGNSTTQVSQEETQQNGWRDAMLAAYRLAPGQNLKHVPEPFIPERLEYYRTKSPGQARRIPRGPDVMYFHWSDEPDSDGEKLRRWGMTFSSSERRLRHILDMSLHIDRYEYAISPDWLNRPMPVGDWVIRIDASTQDQLNDLARLLEGPPMRFVQRTVVRPVAVATGHFEFDPVPGSHDAGGVHFFTETLDPNEAHGGASGDFDKFFEKLGDRLGVQVINQTQGEPPQHVTWYYNRDGRIPLEGAEKQRLKRERLLRNVSNQTGLRFELEERQIEVWRLEPDE